MRRKGGPRVAPPHALKTDYEIRGVSMPVAARLGTLVALVCSPMTGS